MLKDQSLKVTGNKNIPDFPPKSKRKKISPIPMPFMRTLLFSGCCKRPCISTFLTSIPADSEKGGPMTTL